MKCLITHNYLKLFYLSMLKKIREPEDGWSPKSDRSVGIINLKD
jgi:hypothetical protein